MKNNVLEQAKTLRSSTQTQYYRALAAKDTRFDGVFFAGILTTGIYCRPICRVKTPKASSCVFFSSQAAAEAAGFRPCLRCRPELAPYDVQQNLAHAIWQKIAEGALNEQSVEAFSLTVGLSSRQLRRVMLAEFGVGPIEAAQTQRLLLAKKLLQETDLPMTEVAYAAGFGSLRRFNALFEARYQLQPSEIRRTASEPQTGLQLRLAYRPPFAWTALLHYLHGRAMRGLEWVDLQQGQYCRSVRISNGKTEQTGWLSLRHDEDKQQLILALAPALVRHLAPILARVRALLDLEANPLVIAQHLASASLLASPLEKTPGLRVPGAFDPFELAIRAILGQQVSVAGASTIASRLVQTYGQTVSTPWPEVSHHFPLASDLAALSVDEVARLGMPKARAKTLIAIAAWAAQGGLQKQTGASLETVLKELKALPGIGEWTAQYIAMRGLRMSDAFPAGDLGLQKAISRQTGEACSEKQLLALSQAWSPWRSYAALLLWQTLTEEVV